MKQDRSPCLQDKAEVEFEALEWVGRFNHRRLHEPMGEIQPAEAEAKFHDTVDESA